MLKRPPATPQSRPNAQSGIVLFFALLVLILMSLSALALMRSTLTTNLVAGNLAFQHAATGSADRGVEAAVNWLESNASGTTLYTSRAGTDASVHYSALRQDPASNQSWDDFWTAALVPAGLVNTLSTDAAGITVSYVIHRLCNAQGDPASGRGCETSPTSASASNSSKGAGVVSLTATGQVYYRITVRATGPRNTVSFVQVVIAM